MSGSSAAILPASKAKEGFMGLLRQVLSSGRRVRISHNRMTGAAVLLAEDELQAMEARIQLLSDPKRLARIARTRRAVARKDLVEYIPRHPFGERRR